MTFGLKLSPTLKEGNAKWLRLQMATSQALGARSKPTGKQKPLWHSTVQTIEGHASFVANGKIEDCIGNLKFQSMDQFMQNLLRCYLSLIAPTGPKRLSF